jgi:hypothetical protein
MVTIAELWQPILLSAVLSFFSGFVLYMLVPLHAKDWRALPDEAGLMSRMREAKVEPGNYLFPCPATPKEMATPEFNAKLEQGPVGIAIVRAGGRVSLGPQLAKMMVYHLVVSVMVAYLAGRALGPGTEYLRVFQVAGTVAVLSYTAGIFPFAIWYQPSSRYVINQVLDGIVWGLLTAGAFGWLWPQ